jgi:Ferritin-like domain
MTLDLSAIDRDGAVREAQDALLSRSQLLAGGLAALGGLAVGLAIPGVAGAQVNKRDRSVLAYLLSLEYLQDAFYTEAERLGALGGNAAAATHALGRVERAHVQAFRQLLGSDAPAAPRFDFQGATEDELAFLRTALALEELAVGAYAGQATRMQNPEVLQAAMDIHTVEARQAAWLRRLLDMRPTDGAFDQPRGRRSVVGTVAAKGFIVARSEVPRTHRRSRTPRFTG